MPNLDRSVHVQDTGEATTQTVANRRGHVLLADEPAALGGADRGFNPFELVAAGLGACTSMTLKMYARHKGIALAGIAIDLRFWRRGENGFSRDTIERKIKLTGELSRGDVERLGTVARRCPVHTVIERAVDIRDEIEILGC
jgi:putative redox protein